MSNMYFIFSWLWKPYQLIHTHTFSSIYKAIQWPLITIWTHVYTLFCLLLWFNHHRLFSRQCIYFLFYRNLCIQCGSWRLLTAFWLNYYFNSLFLAGLWIPDHSWVTESAHEWPRSTRLSSAYWPIISLMTSSLFVVLGILPDTESHLPLSLSHSISLSLCALPKQITPYLCERAVQLCRRLEACGTSCFKMRKEGRLTRWIGWTVIVAALLLLGFIIGKTW